LKADRLCSVVDGTVDFDPKPTRINGPEAFVPTRPVITNRKAFRALDAAAYINEAHTRKGVKSCTPACSGTIRNPKTRCPPNGVVEAGGLLREATAAPVPHIRERDED
jgi:hypothetical protein